MNQPPSLALQLLYRYTRTLNCTRDRREGYFTEFITLLVNSLSFHVLGNFRPYLSTFLQVLKCQADFVNG